MTPNKQALREHYSPKPVPKCQVCGDEMTVQRMSASRVTYGCTGAMYDADGCHYADGRSIADDHYAQSRITVVDVSDPDVLALLDELEAAEKKTVEMPSFDGYVPHVARELKAAFRIACDNAGINIAAAGKGE